MSLRSVEVTFEIRLKGISYFQYSLWIYLVGDVKTMFNNADQIRNSIWEQ